MGRLEEDLGGGLGVDAVSIWGRSGVDSARPRRHLEDPLQSWRPARTLIALAFEIASTFAAISWGTSS